MKYLFALGIALLLSPAAFSQNFPDAIKQPKQVEMKKQHRKFQRQSKRRHHNINHDNALIHPRRRRR
jgi:hypothetical protein